MPAPSKVLLDSSLPEWLVKAPDEFKVKFTTTKGDFTMVVKKEWSPRGADRFYALVKNGYYDGVCFFRVVSGFMAQFGIHGIPAVASAWQNASIKDDPGKQSNKRGMVTFAMRGPNSRTTQIFINYADNSRLNRDGFAAFGKVISGMEAVDKIYSADRDKPEQQRIQTEGTAYLTKTFPKLDYIKKATIEK